MSAKPGRSYEKRFEVAAPVEAVWKAITEGEELTRWFCLEASCEPGCRRQASLRLGRRRQGEPRHHGVGAECPPRVPSPSGPTCPKPRVSEPYAIDWFLEHEGGVTRVRMVASGFGEGPEWDHEYDGTFHGWDMFHKTMKHYLEHHRGQASANVVIYAMLAVPPAEAWSRLLSADGLIKTGTHNDFAIGVPFRFETSQGDLFAGVVHNYVPGKTFSAIVNSLNKSVLNLEMCSIPRGGHFLYVSLNTWGFPRPMWMPRGLASRLSSTDSSPKDRNSVLGACSGQKG